MIHEPAHHCIPGGSAHCAAPYERPRPSNSEGGALPLLAWSADRGSSFVRWRDSRGCSCVAGPHGLLACPLIGSMAGVIIAIALVVTFPLALESGILTSVVPIFADRAHWGEVIIANPSSMEVLIGPAILGAVVGTVLWFIGRPARPSIAALLSPNSIATGWLALTSRAVLLAQLF